MLRAGGVESALGINTVVSLLHWYDLGDEVVIVMERPVPSMELLDYVNERVDPLTEDEAKVRSGHQHQGTADDDATLCFS